ncbi:MAG: D-alanine--D-alanine ligase family protein [Saccharofermentanales bacterium]
MITEKKRVKNKVRTVCVLFGGVSTEHIISLRSAYNVIFSLKKAGFQVVPVGITRTGRWIRFTGEDSRILDGTWEEETSPTTAIRSSDGISVRDFIAGVSGIIPDVIFPVIHGINCEDGTVQGLLELSGIPYVGCNVLASAAGMDKLHSKRIFRTAGIPQCRFIAATRAEIHGNIARLESKVSRRIGYPCFLKPNNGGSSVGTMRVDSPGQLRSALLETSVYDSVTLVEEWIPAREVEAAVIGNESPKVALLGEVLTAEDIQYYDYHTKYFNAEGSRLCIPADITPAAAARIRRYAKKAYMALGCSGLSRVDFFIDKRDGRILINEINTLPGFTPISLFPKAWELSGLPPEKLVAKLCSYAVSYKNSRQRLETI